MRDDVLQHILFSGPPGLGKTTLAYIIGNAVATIAVSRWEGELDKTRLATALKHKSNPEPVLGETGHKP